MKNKGIHINAASLKATAAKTGQILKPYAGVLFFLLIALAYGFLVLRINSLSAAPVNPANVDTQVKAAPTPHVDPKVIQQLQALKDNSVNVQTLFQGSRTNPFQE